MPFIGSLTLEFCDVATDDVSLEDVVRAARLTPRDVQTWFLTLSRANEDYMDVTLNESGTFHIHCGEGELDVIAEPAVDDELLVSLLTSFYEHDNQWKQRLEWQPRKKKSGLLGFFR